MRSSAIAEELIARGEEVIFVGDYSEVHWLASRIRTLGFSQILSVNGGFISDPETDVLILDSYIVPIEDDFIQQKKWKGVVALVDDITPPYKTDLNIHPGLSVHGMPLKSSKILSGPKFIPFRKSIKKATKSVDKLSVLEILVVGGGTDSFNFVGAVYEILRNIDFNFQAYIFTNSDEFLELDPRFTVFPIGPGLDEIANNVELVFTTASTTSLEFICREVAVGIGCAVDNQEQYYETLSSTGVAFPIGRYTERSWAIDKSTVALLVQSNEVRDTLRQNCAGLIDIDGARRIVDEILKF
jgi:spore coat polysaccharide biosynthesis predicted glycosyltransferase SpsG